MALDANGVWQYEETDSEATASDLLNLGMASVSTRINTLQADIDGKEPELGDTGWVAVPVGSGYSAYTGYEPQVRRIGSVVHWRGGWDDTGLSASANHNDIGTVPGGFRPVGNTFHTAVTNSADNSGKIVFFADGGVRLDTGSSLGSYYVAFLTWTID